MTRSPPHVAPDPGDAQAKAHEAGSWAALSGGGNQTPIPGRAGGAQLEDPVVVSRADELFNDSRRSSLEDFLALVAHEVTTPLTVAKGAVVTLRRLGPLAAESERAEMVAMIDRNVDLAILLMGRMALARDIEKGAVTLRKERVDLVTIVRESVDDLRIAILGDHPVAVTGIDELSLAADPTAAREIVFNVLSNAAKYSAPAAPIEVRLGRKDNMGMVVVRNHGRGVTPGDTDHIFDKFFQVDGEAAGVGLGLFVSRGLARAHGGDLTVRPAAQAGSEFVLVLPAP